MSKIKKIRRNLHEIENEKNLFTPKVKEIKKNLLELERNLFKLKKYYNYEYIKYKEIRDVRNVFNLPFNEDYCKPIRTSNAFNNNFIKYGSIGDKDKTLKIKEYLDMIRPYLSDIINDHQTQGEWKIQLTIAINFIFSKDSDETHFMCSKSNNIEIMMGSETYQTTEELFECLLQEY